MFKYLILAIGVALSHSSVYLTLVDCQYKSYPVSGYQGLYKSISGNYYTFYFKNYCPYSQTLR